MVSHLPPPPCLKNPHPQMANECTQCSISSATRDNKQVKSPQPENTTTNGKETGDHMQGKVRTGGLITAGRSVVSHPGGQCASQAAVPSL